MASYCRQAHALIEQFKNISFHRILRSGNAQADALSKLASTLVVPEPGILNLMVIDQKFIPVTETLAHRFQDVLMVDSFEVEKSEWYQALEDYLKDGRQPEDRRERLRLRKIALRYFYLNDTLYRKSFDGILLRCLNESEAQEVLKEVHAGICGAHKAGDKLCNQIQRLGYFWPSMAKDSKDFYRSCRANQLHGNFIHQPPELLVLIKSS